MAFVPVSGTRLDPAYLVRRILTNSLSYSVGECVMSYTTGYCPKGVAAAPILGIIVGFENNDGSLIKASDVSKSTTAYTGSIDSLTAASDNQTVAKQKAVICCDPHVIWSVNLNGTIGTTNSSDLPGCKIDVDSANTTYTRVLESTASRTASTVCNFAGHGADPSDTTRILVSIQCSEIFSSKQG